MSEKYNTINNQIGSVNYTLIPENFQDVQNSYNVTENNISQKEMHIQMEEGDVICCSSCFVFFILLVTFLFVLIIIEKSPFISILFISIILIIIILAFLLYLSLHTRYIKLFKNESLNLLTVKKINYLNRSKSSIYFNLKNVILDIIKYQNSYEGIITENEALIIAKIFNDNSEIDLNTSNIQNVPIKNLYYIFTGFKNKIYTSNSLRKFLGINLEIENPVNFNIYKYMGIIGNIPKFTNYQLSRYMKFSDHFYTYFLKTTCCYCGIKSPIYTSLIAIAFLIFPCIVLFGADNVNFLPFAIYIFSILGISSIIIIFNIIAIIKYCLRIDIIYSNDFDTIFIALLNHNGTSYKKKFMNSINSIERFILENYETSYDKSILKVIYKNKNIEEIFIINENKFRLEELLFILNEKLNKNINV